LEKNASQSTKSPYFPKICGVGMAPLTPPGYAYARRQPN